MEIYEAIILGILQGLTEFLPVSSSGHLVIGKALFGVHNPGIAFEVFVHFGTLLSIIVMFWGDIRNLLVSFFRGMGKLGRLGETYRSDADFRMSLMIIIGTLPAVVIGLAFKDIFEAMFDEPQYAGGALIITGLMLIGTRFAKEEGKEINPNGAIGIGFAQAFAIIPGISRSGSTISAAMFLGVKGEDAARFSFLLAIPAVLGAAILQTFDLMSDGFGEVGLGSLAAGTIAAFLVGLGAISLLMKAVRQGKISIFGWYCIPLGVISIWYF